MTVRPLVFTGCGRSGTGYIAQVLAHAGLDAGHERVFAGYPAPEAQGELVPGTVESSWFAAPFLQGRPATEVAVVHLVRDPLTWIDSWLRSGAMSRRFTSRYLKRWCPEMMREASPLRAAMWFWVRWNERVERHATLRIRIEDVDEEQLACALGDAGLIEPDGSPVSDGRLAAALLPASTPRDYNHKGGPPRTLTWDDLPFGFMKKGVQVMAEYYGYPVVGRGR